MDPSVWLPKVITKRQTQNRSTFGSLSHSLSKIIAHTSVSFITQPRWIVSRSGSSFTIGFVRSRPTSLPVADCKAISLLAPAPSLPWLLSPQSLLALSQRRPQPADPSEFSEVGRGIGEDGAVEGWKDGGTVGELCSTEARQPLSNYHPLKVSHSENQKPG